jgi:predicted RNase H-like nuclease
LAERVAGAREIWVLGLDACQAGWAGICWSGGARVHGVFGADVRAAVEAAQGVAPIEVVAIDIPIGLPDATVRRADIEGRHRLKPHGSRVFATPPRRAIEAGSYAEARAIGKELTGKGVSAQAYALRQKVLDVDAYVRVRPPLRVVEVHPEVSFAAMGGGPVAWSKRTWRGQHERRRLLATAGLVVPDDLGPLGELSPADDVLDAAAAAWTALRVAHGQASSLPERPEAFSDGWPAAIWV